jgi:hypothetical protein
VETSPANVLPQTSPFFYRRQIQSDNSEILEARNLKEHIIHLEIEKIASEIFNK